MLLSVLWLSNKAGGGGGGGGESLVSKVRVCVAVVHTVTVGMMGNNVIAEDGIWRRRDLSLGGISSAPQTVICTAIHHCSSVGLTFHKPYYRDKYPED